MYSEVISEKKKERESQHNILPQNFLLLLLMIKHQRSQNLCRVVFYKKKIFQTF